MDELQATVEFSVEFHKFVNVDLFQRGFYQVRVGLRVNPKLPCKIEVSLPKNSSCSLVFPACIVNGTAVSKTFQILYKNEEVQLDDVILFKTHLLVDGHRVRGTLRKADFQLDIELWFTDQTFGPDQHNSIQCVSSRTLKLHFDPFRGLHHHLPVMFDYFHLSAVTVTIHASLITLCQPYLSISRGNRPPWSNSTSRSLQKQQTGGLEALLFGPPGSCCLLPSARLHRACLIHWELCSTLLLAFNSLQRKLNEYMKLLPPWLQLKFESLDSSGVLEGLSKYAKECHKYCTSKGPRPPTSEHPLLQTKITETQEDFLMIANSDIAQLCGAVIVLWQQFLEVVVGCDKVRQHLARQRHLQRVKRFAEGFFIVERSRQSVVSCCDVSTQVYEEVTEALRRSNYLSLLPPLEVECVDLDGDSSTLPIIYEEQYQEMASRGPRLSHSSQSTISLCDVSFLIEDREPNPETTSMCSERRASTQDTSLKKSLMRTSESFNSASTLLENIQNSERSLLVSKSHQQQMMREGRKKSLKDKLLNNFKLDFDPGGGSREEYNILSQTTSRSTSRLSLPAKTKFKSRTVNIFRQLTKTSAAHHSGVQPVTLLGFRKLDSSGKQYLNGSGGGGNGGGPTDFTSVFESRIRHSQSTLSMMTALSIDERRLLCNSESLPDLSSNNIPPPPPPPLCFRYASSSDLDWIRPEPSPLQPSLKNAPDPSSMAAASRKYSLAASSSYAPVTSISQPLGDIYTHHSSSGGNNSRRNGSGKHKRAYSTGHVANFVERTSGFCDIGKRTLTLANGDPHLVDDVFVNGGVSPPASSKHENLNGDLMNHKKNGPKNQNAPAASRYFPTSDLSAAFQKELAEQCRKVAEKQKLTTMMDASASGMLQQQDGTEAMYAEVMRPPSPPLPFKDPKPLCLSPTPTPKNIITTTTSSVVAATASSVSSSSSHPKGSSSSSSSLSKKKDVAATAAAAKKDHHHHQHAKSATTPTSNGHGKSSSSSQHRSSSIPNNIPSSHCEGTVFFPKPPAQFAGESDDDSCGDSSDEKSSSQETTESTVQQDDSNSRSDDRGDTSSSTTDVVVENAESHSATDDELCAPKLPDGGESGLHNGSTTNGRRGGHNNSNNNNNNNNSSGGSSNKEKDLRRQRQQDYLDTKCTILEMLRESSNIQECAYCTANGQCDQGCVCEHHCQSVSEMEGGPSLRRASAIGSDTISFVRAKEEFRQHLGAPWLWYSDFPVLASCIPYFQCDNDLRAFSPDGIHLVVCVHGLDGNSADLRLLRTYLELGLPTVNFEFLMSQRNQGETFDDFETMTSRLVEEIVYHIEVYGLKPTKISFIGHSLGNIIIRSALSRPELEPWLDRLHTFLSLSGPHLGTSYNNSGLVNMGMWFMQKWKKSGSLLQLAMKDSHDIRQTFLYKLSQKSGLEHFRNVLLCGSSQDRYVPLHSAHIELCRAAIKDSSFNGAAYREMVTNLLHPILEKPSITFVRYDVHHALPSNANSLIGRAAHIAVLDSELFIEKFMTVCGLKYFV